MIKHILYILFMGTFYDTSTMWCGKVASWLTFVDNMDEGYTDFGNYFLFKPMKKIFYALLTCSMALGGASVGIIVGAIKGQTTETGFVGGAGVGVMVGAITAVQILDLMVNGYPFSKVALLYSLLNGKVYKEWVTPALLRAYQSQTSILEENYLENSDIFENNGTEGLAKDVIKMLPTSRFCPCKNQRPCQVISCIICLEDFKKREFTRMLPRCGHTFHENCIDEWLIRHGSCPMCRRELI